MSTSKEVILEAVRRNRPASCAAPELRQAWTIYPDRRAQFIDVLTAVGGTAFAVRDEVDLNERLRLLPIVCDARKTVSLLPGIGEPNVDLSNVGSPHALADVDVAILPGEFAVAENAAVWITDRDVPLRVIYFLCQHLVLVVPAGAIVDNMHAAYERLASSGAESTSVFAEPIFGAFISGPSKTADIEQSLVIGAHGPRSLTVFVLGT
ncbi:MAG TPA: LUD domain-containing protein [Lacipirellulaceae bacterium]|nr:LUD domain-containing protein [Lacipirellulaceae bacterium]